MMKRLTLWIALSACLALTVLQASAKVYTPQNLPKVHLQDKTRYTCNPDQILSAAACDSIDRMLYALEQQTGIESVVAVVGSIGETECFDFCHQLLNEWGVGKKGKNNGLVILLVTDQRCIQFYTGYGLEGDLPDALCKRIQTRDMIPFLKDQRWDEGMVAGVRATCARLDGSMTNDSADSDEEDMEALIAFVVIFALLILIAIGVGIWAVWRASQCPQCGKHKLQRTSSRVLYRRGGVKKEEVIYTCLHCGHVLRREQSSYDERYKGGGSGPILFGGSGGGFGGGFGGSSFGGSFGGGIGGGGGAGSRF